MDFPSTVGAPRMAYSHDGKRFWMIKPLSLWGYGVILRWLDDAVPGQDKRVLPPLMGSLEAQEALLSPTGSALMIWLALHDRGTSEEEAAAISASLTDVERYTWLRALQTQRRTAPKKDPEKNEELEEKPKDLSEIWFGEDFARLVLKLGTDQVFALTIDQYQWLVKEGQDEDENPEYSPEKLLAVQDDMQAKFGDQLARLSVMIAPPKIAETPEEAAATVDADLTARGLRIKPESEAPG
jgi:hypothetical protein